MSQTKTVDLLAAVRKSVVGSESKPKSMAWLEGSSQGKVTVASSFCIYCSLSLVGSFLNRHAAVTESWRLLRFSSFALGPLSCLTTPSSHFSHTHAHTHTHTLSLILRPLRVQIVPHCPQPTLRFLLHLHTFAADRLQLASLLPYLSIPVSLFRSRSRSFLQQALPHPWPTSIRSCIPPQPFFLERVTLNL